MHMSRIVQRTLFVLLVCAVFVGQQRPLANPEYVPVFAKASNTAAQRGSLKGDFDWATRSSSLSEAASRWEEFVHVHYPADGEYEDEFEKNHVIAAQYELMRVYYLRGQVKKGDEILKKINPLGL
jgi:hypothetical protein